MSKTYSVLVNKFNFLSAKSIKEDKPECIKSWSPSLNWALTTGGYMPGKVYVLYGPESSGKSMLAMMAIIELQRQDPKAVALWFDTEFSFSPDFFVKLGGDPDRLFVKATNNPVEIFDLIAELNSYIESGDIDSNIRGIVIDSIRAIRFPKDLKKVSTDSVMGGTGANYLPSALKMILPVIAKNRILTFFTQQVIMQLDPMKALRSPYVLPDGQALKHAADVMLEIVKIETKNSVIERGVSMGNVPLQVGHKVRVKVKKNRLGQPARTAEFVFSYEHGIIDKEQEIFSLAKNLGVIYHPNNPKTNKPNNMLWAFRNYDPVKGEANMLKFISDPKILEEVLDDCYKMSIDTSHLNIDSSGFVNDELDSFDDINVSDEDILGALTK